MPFIHVPKSWQLPERVVTSEAAFLQRRRFLKALTGFSIAGSALALAGCQSKQATGDTAPIAGTKALEAISNPAFVDADRPITNELIAATYNNFYEFGGNKSIWQNAQALPTDPWKVEVTGLVNNPRVFDLDDLLNFPLEERIYRFRCVEAWAMVVPWLGFPMSALMKAVEPTSNAKFVRFTSYFDPQVTKGPGFPPVQFLPFPYTEGLRIEEMANELAFFAVGIYGHTLPKQHGAPIRAVLPWKYGFKGAKSIVKIEFISTQPATYWNTISPGEYKFESNVDPQVPHPRWSQAKERLISPGGQFAWEEVPTLKYNGYGEYVASLYS
ncbi:protein-methionine-sulfoxide reductase catalytic subunit MsrP [Oscillatoria sp. FACHB-1407]|uniref:protein-methionine-sulfoxide reductase catalytic subunit MsrP n=1 Tax=Oscillatoria sp. FACHB-1407 TaxID=2692847 RepID=UPI00168A22EC|nr:protein-methionine-sulfoxide reductase catalytic subunit MsrP [Oscillatoria sp. FACHB-1407]MBD2461772.1 protein-methionine-sulfoxide reductase catalytic subunit MsrP [Oscillatoria sp. FACHB-1407]